MAAPGTPTVMATKKKKKARRKERGPEIEVDKPSVRKKTKKVRRKEVVPEIEADKPSARKETKRGRREESGRETEALVKDILEGHVETPPRKKPKKNRQKRGEAKTEGPMKDRSREVVHAPPALERKARMVNGKESEPKVEVLLERPPEKCVGDSGEGFLPEFIPLSSKPRAGGGLKVFVGGLPRSFDRETVQRDFEECGAIANFSMPMDENGNSKGVAFITYKNQAGVEKALAFNGDEYGGRKLSVSIAEDKKRDMGKGKGSNAIGKGRGKSKGEGSSAKGTGRDKSKGKGKSKGNCKGAGKAAAKEMRND